MAINKTELNAILATDQIAFTERCFGVASPNRKYYANWHIDCIIEHLQAIERGELKRLIINMPPRSLKSICVSIAWPAWLLGHHPSMQIVCASYGHSLATKLSQDTRLVVESDWYREAFPATQIAADQNEKAKFQTTLRGHRIATSVGGAITGEGGDILILDDPIKPDESLSEAVRLSTNDWFTQSFLSRFNDRRAGAAVLVMQRVHELDPTAVALEMGWHSLVLPARFEKRTVIKIGRRVWECEEGDYLHRERLGVRELASALDELKIRGYTAQYLQKPTPPGGGEFKATDIQFYDNYSRTFSARGMNVYILYDPANTKKNKGRAEPDYTAIIVVGLASDNNYYILDLMRDRLNPVERVDKLMFYHRKWNKKSGKPPRVVSEQYGMMTDNFYIKRRMDEDNYRFKIIEVGGDLKKEDRIRGLIPCFESQRVFLPRKILYDTMDNKQVELVKDFIEEELLTFPNGKHDDMIDAFSRLLDPKVNATFPKENVLYLEAGQSRLDMEGGGFRDDDFASW